MGIIVNPDHDLLKTEICSHAVVIPDCMNSLKVHLQPINTTTWDMPSSTPVCADRAEPIQPVTVVNMGGGDEIMMVRVCAVADAMFPTTGIGLRLPKDGQGGYRLIAMSAFVNEPN